MIFILFTCLLLICFVTFYLLLIVWVKFSQPFSFKRLWRWPSLYLTSLVQHCRQLTVCDAAFFGEIGDKVCGHPVCSVFALKWHVFLVMFPRWCSLMNAILIFQRRPFLVQPRPMNIAIAIPPWLFQHPLPSAGLVSLTPHSQCQSQICPVVSIRSVDYLWISWGIFRLLCT